jgi:nucleoside-diphosphate-sugar epimerase
MNTIALFGAAGAIGQSIATASSARGSPYRVVGRSREALTAVFRADPLAEIVTWNPDDPASVQAAAAGVDAIVYVVGVNYWQFELHPRLMQQTLDGAIAAGVPRLVLIGTVYPYGRPRSRPVREDHPREPHTFKGRMRTAQEDLLRAAHAEGKLQATILRLPDFYGPGVDKSFLHGAFVAAVNGGVANMVGPLDTPHESVFVPDVGPVVARLAFMPNAYGRVWQLAGAGVATQRAIIEEIERQIGHRLRVRVAGKTMLRLLGVFNPFMRELVEMHYLLTDPDRDQPAVHSGYISPCPQSNRAEPRQAPPAAVRTRRFVRSRQGGRHARGRRPPQGLSG